MDTYSNILDQGSTRSRHLQGALRFHSCKIKDNPGLATSHGEHVWLGHGSKGKDHLFRALPYGSVFDFLQLCSCCSSNHAKQQEKGEY